MAHLQSSSQYITTVLSGREFRITEDCLLLWLDLTWRMTGMIAGCTCIVHTQLLLTNLDQLQSYSSPHWLFIWSIIECFDDSRFSLLILLLLYKILLFYCNQLQSRVYWKLRVILLHHSVLVYLDLIHRSYRKVLLLKYNSISF